MKIHWLPGAVAAVLFVVMPARAGEDEGLARLATCQDSWLDWSKSDPVRLQTLAKHIGAGFSHHDNDPFAVPKAETSVMGLRIAQVYPQSVGMGVGFSLTLAAPFDQARNAMEKSLGKSVGKCETGDGMRMCELNIAEKRTFVLMAEDSPTAMQTLVGCYYYYEK